jgi:hypothetical protein
LVKNFKLGTSAEADGQVTLTVQSNGADIAGCPAQTSSSETTAGNGTVDFTLAAGCVGSNVTLTAVLTNTATPGVPVVPAVGATVTVSAIQ